MPNLIFFRRLAGRLVLLLLCQDSGHATQVDRVVWSCFGSFLSKTEMPVWFLCVSPAHREGVKRTLHAVANVQMQPRPAECAHRPGADKQIARGTLLWI